MSGAAPDADILGLMRTADGAHGLRPRAPDTLVPLRPPLTFNLAFQVRCGERLVNRSGPLRPNERVLVSSSKDFDTRTRPVERTGEPDPVPTTADGRPS